MKIDEKDRPCEANVSTSPAGFSIDFSFIWWYHGEAGRIALILIRDSFP